MDLKGEEALFEIGQRSKVIRGEDLSLNDREVDLDRIEPTGVGRGVDEDCMGHWAWKRSAALWPRWTEQCPIQKTRRADL